MSFPRARSGEMSNSAWSVSSAGAYILGTSDKILEIAFRLEARGELGQDML
jgi:hypothetical protein